CFGPQSSMMSKLSNMVSYKFLRENIVNSCMWSPRMAKRSLRNDGSVPRSLSVGQRRKLCTGGTLFQEGVCNLTQVILGFGAGQTWNAAVHGALVSAGIDAAAAQPRRPKHVNADSCYLRARWGISL